MQRRSRFLLGLGLVSLAIAASSRADEPTLTLDFRDAPARSALELVLSLENKSYTIGSGVSGFLTAKVAGQRFGSAMDIMVRGLTTPAVWTADPMGIVHIEARPGPAGPPPSFPKLAPDVNFIRVAAIGSRGAVRKAVVEFGRPPESSVAILGVGERAIAAPTGIEWTMVAIGPSTCTLKAARQQRMVPLWGLTPPRR